MEIYRTPSMARLRVRLGARLPCAAVAKVSVLPLLHHMLEEGLSVHLTTFRLTDGSLEKHGLRSPALCRLNPRCFPSALPRFLAIRVVLSSCTCGFASSSIVHFAPPTIWPLS